jgi:hypothetical protein
MVKVPGLFAVQYADVDRHFGGLAQFFDESSRVTDQVDFVRKSGHPGAGPIALRVLVLLNKPAPLKGREDAVNRRRGHAQHGG